jgi:enterochelin esterase-like enzyme
MEGVLLRLADPDERYTAVRLASDLPPREFSRDDGEWRLELDEPPVERLEYQLEVEHDDGGTEYLLDPDNPHTAPGAFGDKSVLLLPTYEPPAWLEAPQVEGQLISLTTPGRGLGVSVDVDLWGPADADPSEPLPLLVAHDGPEYDKLADLTSFAAAKIAAGELPRHRIALLAPGERDEWYSASPRYLRALVHQVLPAVAHKAPTDGPPAAMGASLGALALVHAQRRHPGTFHALFLQSGSFFMPRFDAHESGFPHYHRIVGFVSETLRLQYRTEVPTTLTCGAAEENIHNNRVMAESLQAPLHELTDTHNYTAWRDAFDPHLTRLLAETW